MKKGLFILIALITVFLCACGSSSSAPAADTQVSTNNVQQIKLDWKYPEINDDATVEMGNAFIQHYYDAIESKSIADAPEEFLTAASYFYWNFDASTAECAIGDKVWTAFECLEDGLTDRFTELMKEAKELFEKEAGFTF